MKILMIGPDSKAKGGMATVLNNFKSFTYTDCQIIFLTSWREKHRIWTAIKCFFQIRKTLKQQQIDLIHFHVAQKGSFFRKAFLLAAVPKKYHTLFHMHASQFDTFYEVQPTFMKKWIGKVFNRVDEVVVLSQEWAQFYWGLTNTKISIIENAVFIPKKNPYATNQKLIVTFGKIGERKGSYDILNIAKQVATTMPDVKFILYGDGEVNKIQQKIKDLELSNISVGGWLDDKMKSEVMKHAAVHLLPSYQEGLPMAILETMSYGIPNISTDVGGIPQIIQDGENGYTVRPGENQKMARILELFLRSPELQRQLSDKAYQTLNDKFSIDDNFKKWIHLYKKINQGGS
ncbi:glycosyltransferase family 4 protein [Listeria kieliensis]|uniref:Glycosyl transferase n=1 Tax=Listeria kieliensis TaxID=1621700 RepID=A0A3D8TRT3_9LIST|nr:glycosyltransferase family 4 protein [Listeria kieliensis]RDX01367.1 glycosyl transferase [Listeria kieliensis]